MDNIYYITLLLDFYGELLTDKQRSVMSSYYFDDYSLNEIAEEHGITRQSVLDMIKRTKKLLDQYEDKLMLVSKYIERKKKTDIIVEKIDDIIKKGNGDLEEVKELVEHILD